MKPTNSTVGQGLAPAVSNQEIFKNGYGSRGSAPAVKKVFSLFLSIVMLVSVMTGMTITSSASSIQTITFGKEVSGECNANEHDYFQFTVPVSGKVIVNIEGTTYCNDSYRDGIQLQFYDSLYNIDTNKIFSSLTADWKVAFNRGIAKKEINLKSGTYYIRTLRGCEGNTYYDYNILLTYKPNISIPSTLKVSSRSTNALKLSWGKVSGVSGYQLQRKSSDSWKTVATTTSTSSTVKSLKAGTTYSFRVRAYKTINGTKYYSGWRTLKTPTSPSKPAIKTPSTNKKHQITAKWKKVSACSGYQVQYSTSNKFKKSTTKTVSGASKTSCTAKFKKGKKYYIRVRSYKTVDGKKYCSAWSSVKSIKCK